MAVEYIRDSSVGVQVLREAKPSPDLSAFGREIAAIIREAHAEQIPHRMTLRLPNDSRSAFVDRTVTAYRAPPLTVVGGVPEPYVRVGAPLARALRIQEVVFEVSDIPIKDLAYAFSRAPLPVVQFVRHGIDRCLTEV